jgi:translation elongation factor EF-Tu-like GTPase
MSTLPYAAFIEAEVTLLPPDEGGRRSGIRTGYRCNCHFDGRPSDPDHDATFYLLDVDEVAPGAKALTRVHPHHPDDWRLLTKGSTFELREGPRVIGRAVVTDLF